MDKKEQKYLCLDHYDLTNWTGLDCVLDKAHNDVTYIIDSTVHCSSVQYRLRRIESRNQS